MSLFQSRPDGEYRLCRSCVNKGYDEDAWQPATSDFWPLMQGRLWWGRCLACASELTSRRAGVIPAFHARPRQRRVPSDREAIAA